MCIFGGGVESQRTSIVATDWMVTDGPYPEIKAVIGGFTIVDVPSREETLEWPAKFAVAAAAHRRSGRSCSTRSPDRRSRAPASARHAFGCTKLTAPEVPASTVPPSRQRTGRPWADVIDDHTTTPVWIKGVTPQSPSEVGQIFFCHRERGTPVSQPQWRQKAT